MSEEICCKTCNNKPTKYYECEYRYRCLKLVSGPNRNVQHPKYPYKKKHTVYEYNYWEPKRNIYLLSDEDFQL
jgi:hypothetical protein